jgi:hypothetical protein
MSTMRKRAHIPCSLIRDEVVSVITDALQAPGIKSNYYQQAGALSS